MDGQINKGIMEMCLLNLISKEDSYGYLIFQNMHELFPETDTSVFYAILRRFDKLGITECYEGTKTKGPARKYHHVTDYGREYLQERIVAWNKICTTVKRAGIGEGAYDAKTEEKCAEEIERYSNSPVMDGSTDSRSQINVCCGKLGFEF